MNNLKDKWTPLATPMKIPTMAASDVCSSCFFRKCCPTSVGFRGLGQLLQRPGWQILLREGASVA